MPATVRTSAAPRNTATGLVQVGAVDLPRSWIRLASELRCYEPERASVVWARLRHLGARRSQLTHRRDGGGEPDPVGLEYSIVVVICVSSLHRGLSGGD